MPLRHVDEAFVPPAAWTQTILYGVGLFKLVKREQSCREQFCATGRVQLVESRA